MADRQQRTHDSTTVLSCLPRARELYPPASTPVASAAPNLPAVCTLQGGVAVRSVSQNLVGFRKSVRTRPTARLCGQPSASARSSPRPRALMSRAWRLLGAMMRTGRSPGRRWCSSTSDGEFSTKPNNTLPNAIIATTITSGSSALQAQSTPRIEPCSFDLLRAPPAPDFGSISLTLFAPFLQAWCCFTRV